MAGPSVTSKLSPPFWISPVLLMDQAQNRHVRQTLPLPQSIQDWTKESKRTRITNPRKNVDSGLNFPTGSVSFDCKLRDICGWNSASKIGSQYGHWLITRILYIHEETHTLLDQGKERNGSAPLRLPDWAKRKARKYLDSYEDWARFLDHIDMYKEMKPERPVIFGTFSNVRDLHYRIKETFLFPFSEDFDTTEEVEVTDYQQQQDDVTDATDRNDPFDLYVLYQQYCIQGDDLLTTPRYTSGIPIHELVKRTNTPIVGPLKRVKLDSRPRSLSSSPKNQDHMNLDSQPTSRSNTPSGQSQDNISEPGYVKRMRRLQIKTDDTEGTSGFTDLIRSHKQRAIIASKAPEEIAEARINSAFVLLLVTLCLALPTDLKWDQIQRHITSQCGEANLRSIVDGGLIDPNGECHIIIEVKAQRRTEKSWKPLLMQQGLEMVAFVAHAYESSSGPGCVKQRKHQDRVRPSR